MSFLKKLLPFLERIFLAILVIYLALKLLGMVYIILLTISLLGLASVFFLSAYVPSDVDLEESNQSAFAQLLAAQILPRVLGISSSVATVGILFHLLGLEGSPIMLVVGSMTILVVVFIITVMKLVGVKEVDHVIPRLFRSIPVLLFAGYLIITST